MQEQGHLTRTEPTETAGTWHAAGELGLGPRTTFPPFSSWSPERWGVSAGRAGILGRFPQVTNSAPEPHLVRRGRRIEIPTDGNPQAFC